MEDREFTVRVTASENVDVSKYIWEILTQLEGVNGVEAVILEETDGTRRDISEVTDILHELGDTELERLDDAIDEYTKDERNT